MTALIETSLGTVFFSVHGYDRVNQHGIDEEYVGELIEEIAEWEENGGRVIGDVARDGVVWRLVLGPEEDPELHHDWDLVTVTPTSVDVEAAMASGFGEVDAINLALYAN